MILDQKPEGWGVALKTSGSCAGAWKWEVGAVRVGVGSWVLVGGCWRLVGPGMYKQVCLAEDEE